MKLNSFGLDLSQKKIRVVMLHGEPHQLSLKACMTANMPGPGMISESSFDLEEIAVTIRQVIKEANISTPYVHCALPDSVVYSKVVQIPPMSPTDLNNAIYWEAEQNIPAPLSTITLSSQTLRKRDVDGHQMMDILIVGAPNTIVKKYENVMEMSGLKPESLEIEILSVIRSLNFTPNSPVSLVVNVSSFNTTIAIVEEGVIAFIYSIPLGSVAISHAVMTKFNLSEDQAEQYVKEYGLSDQQIGAKIGEAIQPILDSMISEIRKALAYFTDKYRNSSTVSQIVLSGSIGKLTGVDIFFVKSIGIESVVANPWKAHMVQKVPQQIIDTNTDYAVAVGLSLMDYAK